MKRKALSFLLVLLLVMTVFTACDKEQPKKTQDDDSDSPKSSQSEESSSDSKGPLLYKVTDADGDVIWLFGSIHVADDAMYPLPETVLEAYENADSLAVECDVIAFEKDMNAMQSVVSKMLYYDGTTIQNHIDQDLYDEMVEILTEENLYNALYNYYHPFMWQSLLLNAMVERAGYDPEKGIDRYFLDLAKEDDKAIVEIESVEFQHDLSLDFSYEIHELLLWDIVESYDNFSEYEKELNRMVEVWCSGDEAEFAAYLQSTDYEDYSPEEQKLIESYNEKLVTERNYSMTAFAEEALKDGEEVFICVGAAHIVGEEAMADLLKEKGYTVEVVR